MTRQKWLSLALICAIAAPLVVTPLARADRIIIRYPTHEEYHYPIYERRRRPVRRRVTVEFVARGSEWANVFVDGRRIFSPRNVNRRKRFTLREGAYEIKITGADLFDVWAEGYLDVGRDGTNIIVVSFSERGVRVSGDPYTWIPLSAQR